jgi:hypothetical protein
MLFTYDMLGLKYSQLLTWNELDLFGKELFDCRIDRTKYGQIRQTFTHPQLY